MIERPRLLVLTPKEMQLVKEAVEAYTLFDEDVELTDQELQSLLERLE